MYRVTELRLACPRSQTWLFRVASDLAGSRVQDASTQAAARRGGSTTTTRIRPAYASWSLRAFSSSPSLAEDAASMERIVRQARATFGDTLPEGYLSGEEYKLYQRLYGTPLRATQPADVGISLLAHEDNSSGNGSTKIGEAPLSRQRVLLRETASGMLEEVHYEVEAAHGEENEASANEAVHFTVPGERPLTDAQVDHIMAVARNQREFDALTKLQRDFDAARLRAVDSQEAAEEEEEEEEPEEERDEEPEEEEEEEEDPGAVFGPTPHRLHPLTVANYGRTSPTTLQLPKAAFVEPISELLKRTDIKHVQQAAQKAFGGPNLPHSPASPLSKARTGKGNFPQLPVAMEAGHHRMSEIEADAYLAAVLPGVYATATSTLVEVRRRLGSGWIEGLLTKPDGSSPRILDVGGGGAALAAWNQVFWSELDVLRERGVVAPPGETPETPNSSESTPTPHRPALSRRTEKTVVVGSAALRHRLARFLHNTTFLPRLPDLLHSAQNVERHLDAPEVPLPPDKRRKTYDVIIASHLLLPLAKPHMRRALVANLWAHLNPDGGVLILLEKGHPRGFEAVADARQRILDEFIVAPPQSTSAAATMGSASTTAESTEDTPTDAGELSPRWRREPGMIVAPCTNHTKCPMYLTPGLSAGRKDFCHFSQRFIRPPFLQRILGQSHRNHEDIDFSYVAVQRGSQKSQASKRDLDELDAWKRALAAGKEAVMSPLVQGREATDAAFAGYGALTDTSAAPAAPSPESFPNPLSLPRTILPPLKRHGHVILDVCTPAGQLERWTVPKSRSKQAYHDARKAQWGDLWALGAKTRVSRPVRLGKGSGNGDSTGPTGSGESLSRKKTMKPARNLSAAAGDSQAGSGGGDETRSKDKGRKKERSRRLLTELKAAERENALPAE